MEYEISNKLGQRVKEKQHLYASVRIRKEKREEKTSSMASFRIHWNAAVSVSVASSRWVLTSFAAVEYLEY